MFYNMILVWCSTRCRIRNMSSAR